MKLCVDGVSDVSGVIKQKVDRRLSYQAYSLWYHPVIGSMTNRAPDNSGRSATVIFLTLITRILLARKIDNGNSFYYHYYYLAKTTTVRVTLGP